VRGWKVDGSIDCPVRDTVIDVVVSEKEVKRGGLITLPKELGCGPNPIFSNATLPLIVQVAHRLEAFLMAWRVGLWETAGLMEGVDGGMGAEAPLEIIEELF
jgi:hypothetical protein